MSLLSCPLIYFTSNVIFYEPYLNDPLKDVFEVDGKLIFPNDQNISAKRMNMYADICFEKLYNYWDRIGDLIAACTSITSGKRNIYFAKVIDELPSNLIVGDDLNLLINFKENNFKVLNYKKKNLFIITHPIPILNLTI